MMPRLPWFGLVALCLFPFMATPQSSAILVIDSDRVYAQSRFGQQLRNDLMVERRVLEAENERLALELRAEEMRLTEDRKTMPPQDFAALAAAFDAKVQDIRDAQRGKAIDADRKLAQQRQVFERQTRRIIERIMADRGASIVLEISNETIFHVDATADITQEAINRIDAAFAQGR